MITITNATIEILNDIICQTKNDEEIIHILKGAYVQLKDNGTFYVLWTRRYKDFLTTESCSHNSIKQHYRIRSVVVPEILFGLSKKGTWIQLENYPASNPMHLIDYVRYKISGKNIGPFGSSTYIETNPLIIRKSSRKIKRINKIKSNSISKKHVMNFGSELTSVFKNKNNQKYIKKRIFSRLTE